MASPANCKARASPLRLDLYLSDSHLASSPSSLAVTYVLIHPYHLTASVPPSLVQLDLSLRVALASHSGRRREMANWSGIAAALQAIVKPSILQPRLRVPSIASLDFEEFRRRGVVGVVVDKDNCLTKPLEDDLAPSLRPAWHSLLRTFGTANVLVVSNSAGTRKDPLLLQAESVSRNLLVPVLVHSTPKPGHKCARAVADYFLLQHPNTTTASTASKKPIARPPIVWSSQGRALALALAQTSSPSHPTWLNPAISTLGTTPRILIIGDRVTTDMILARRIADATRPLGRVETVSILTTELHAREGLGTTLMRSVENLVLALVERRQRDQRVVEVPDGGEVVGEMPVVGEEASTRANEERWEECTIVTTTAKQVPTIRSAAAVDDAPPIRTGWRRFVPRLVLRRLDGALSLRSIVSTLHTQLSALTSTWTPAPPQQIEGAYKSPLGNEYCASEPLHPTERWRAISGQAVGVAEKAVNFTERLAQNGEELVRTLRKRVEANKSR